MNYYRRYMADYLSKTASLTILEHGAYTLLLDYLYLSEDGRLPPDADEIHRIVRATTSAERQAVDKILVKFFYKDAGGYTNPRAAAEIEKAIPAMEAARANGVKGGRPKNNPVGFDSITQGEPEAKASQPLTPNHQPLSPKTIQPRALALVSSFGISEKIALDWIQLRKAKKAAITETALKGIQREALKAGVSMEDALRTCCERGWAGFKSDWVDKVVAPVSKTPYVPVKPLSADQIASNRKAAVEIAKKFKRGQLSG
ncbi:MAG: YdaU family protein [Bellilinea sp.]